MALANMCTISSWHHCYMSTVWPDTVHTKLTLLLMCTKVGSYAKAGSKATMQVSSIQGCRGMGLLLSPRVGTEAVLSYCR